MASNAGVGLPPHNRISDLPDAILISVLSLLRLDEAVRCTVLASRWRCIFSAFLHDLNVDMPDRREADSIRAVNSILAAHPTAPIRSFRTTKHFGDGWLEELARRGVQKLSLDFDFGCTGERKITIPAALFGCTSLTHLRASWCVFPDPSLAATGSPCLARLTEVSLSKVKISDESLNSLVSQCKALQSLEMTSTAYFGRFHVRSPSLKVLNCDGHFDELFIEYAPNLERLHGRFMYLTPPGVKGVHLKVEHAPKLEFMGYISMSLHAIEIGESIFTEDRIDVKTLMPNLKTLAVEVCYTRKGYINWIAKLLRLFPCLETLYIRSDAWSFIQAAAQESWDVLTHIPCVDNHLQKVVFEVYRGHKWQRGMAKFLHGRGMLLKAMEFHCIMEETDIPSDRFKVPSEEWVREQQELLCLDSRASKDARFLFFKGQLGRNHHDAVLHSVYKRHYYDKLYDV